MSLVTKQSQIHGNRSAAIQIFVGPASFLPLTQGELSRFCFPDRLMIVSQQIRLTFLLAWTTNETQTLCEHIR